MQGRDQFLLGRRFYEVMAGIDLKGVQSEIGTRCEEYERTGCVEPAQDMGRVDSIGVSHIDIQENNIDGTAGGEGQKFLTVQEAVQLQFNMPPLADLLQQAAYLLHLCSLIITYGNAHKGHHLLIIVK